MSPSIKTCPALRDTLHEAIAKKTFRNIRNLKMLCSPQRMEEVNCLNLLRYVFLKSPGGVNGKWLTLTLVRHGESRANAANTHFNRDADNYLTPRGDRDARFLGNEFANVQIDALYSSPLLRARSTAKHIADANKCHPEILIMENLKEQEYGATVDRLLLTGDLDEARRLRRGVFVDGHMDRSYRPTGEGESLNDLSWRAKCAVLMAIDKHGVELETRPTRMEETPHVVFVAHNILLCELYESLDEFVFPNHAGQNEHNWTEVSYRNASWSRHILFWGTEEGGNMNVLRATHLVKPPFESFE